MRGTHSTLLLVALAAATAGAAPPLPPLTLGITQVYGPDHARAVGPVVEPYLSKVLGTPVTVKAFADPDALAEALAARTVDLAWVTPLAFVHAVKKDPDVIAVAKAMRDGQVVYRSVLFVRKDSALAGVKKLEGSTVAWVSPASTSGYLYPRELLRRAGVDLATAFASERFEQDHPGVCRAVKSGAAQVGATYAAERPDGGDIQADGCGPDAGAMRVLASTGNVPNEVIAARSDFPPSRLNDVIAAFGRMSLSEEGRTVLARAFKADAFGAAVDGDFDGLVALVELASRPRVAPAEKKRKKKGGR